MRTKRRWNGVFLLCLATLLILMTGSVQPAKSSEYVEASYSGSSESDDYDNQYSSYGKKANTLSSHSGSSCGCSVDTTTWAQDGSGTSASASASAWCLIDWTWNGPPGEAPGGDLSWSISGSGSVSADGSTTISNPNTQSADSSAGASSGISLSATEGSSEGDAWVSGSVVDDANGVVDGDAYGDSTGFDYNPDPLTWAPQDEGAFDVGILWDLDDSVDTYYVNIGESYAYVSGDADCGGWSGVSTTGSGAGASSSSDASASASISGSVSEW